MAKREQMYRLMYVREFLKSKPKGATYEQIRNYLEEKYYKDSFDGELAFSEKTFKRDRNLLEELFGVEIGFKRSTMTYQILEDGFSDSSQTIFDNLFLVNAYRQTAKESNIILFAKRQSNGLHHLEGIIYAIKNRKTISLNYTKSWENKPSRKVVEPYAVKEFSNRWYLLCNESDGKEFFIKTLGLDRISDLEIHNKTFKMEEVEIQDMFKNSFGIVSTLGQTPEEIKISFTAFQGRYIKTLPLHSSQKVLIDNDSEYKIELNLVPTYDFYQELLKNSEGLLSIEPKSVKEQYESFLKTGLENLKTKKK